MADSVEFDAREIVRMKVAGALGGPLLDTWVKSAVADGLEDVISRAKRTVVRKSSALGESIGPRPIIAGNITSTGIVGIVSATAPHAMAIEYGSGTKAEGFSRGFIKIVPRNKKWLRWQVGDSDVFAQVVYHPGVSPQPYLRPAFVDAYPNMKTQIVATAKAAILQALGLGARR